MERSKPGSSLGFSSSEADDLNGASVSCIGWVQPHRCHETQKPASAGFLLSGAAALRGLCEVLHSLAIAVRADDLLDGSIPSAILALCALVGPVSPGPAAARA